MQRNDIMEQLRQQMKNDKPSVKFKRWLNIQWWLFYCLLTNNRMCRYFKYNKLISKQPETCSYCGKKLRKKYKFNPFLNPTSHKCDRWICTLLKKLGIYKIDIS